MTEQFTLATPVNAVFTYIGDQLQKILPPSVYAKIRSIFDYLVGKWFFIGLAVFIALAHSYPGATQNVHIDYWAVALIFFISGISIPTNELADNLYYYQAHFTVLTMSFLITSSIVYGICCGIRAAGNKTIADWMLVGLIVTHTCPTTVSSNVVMTRQAGGNVALCLCEVVIGNMLGTFITPALSQLYLSGSWEFANPANDSSVEQVYRRVMMQIGLSVFVPMFVGQVILYLFPRQCSFAMKTFVLNKVGTFCLLLVMWSSFCTAFRQNAFKSVSHASIIMICFFNVGIYLFFTVLCFLYARPLFIKQLFHNKPSQDSSKTYKIAYKILKPFYYSRKDTVTIMLCGPAKTAALGVSLVTSQYGRNFDHLGQLLVPLVLYQAEQVFTAGLLVPYMHKWIDNEPKIIDESSIEEGIPDTSDTSQSASTRSNPLTVDNSTFNDLK